MKSVRPEDFRTLLPFRYLSPQGIASLAAQASLQEIPAGTTIIEQGNAADKLCYILLEGRAEVLDLQGRRSTRIKFIDDGHYFGEWEALFEVPRFYSIRTLVDCTCAVFEGSVLVELLAQEQAFAQAFAAILRDRQGIFKGFELFYAEVRHGIGKGHIKLSDLLPLYQSLVPALHGGANDPGRVDFAALDYAVRRLPTNVGATFAFLIRDELPVVYEQADQLFEPIPTDARRRAIWEVLPGKDLLVLRSGLSDLMDFLTCLCVFAVEASKIRHRLYEGNVIRTLKSWLADNDNGDAAVEAQFIHSLGFTRDEVAGLCRVWPKKTARRLWQIINHREMFSIDIRRQDNQYNQKNFKQWSIQIGEACKTLLGNDPRELDPSIGIHIISSNTHSVTNCLNPWYAANADSIREWAKSQGDPVLDEPWQNAFDCVYALTRDYFKAFPGAEPQMVQWEKDHGIVRLSATPSTGIEAQLIDLSRTKGLPIDPDLPVDRPGRDVILNIDFAFGEQAQDIIHQLILLFGPNIRSVNLLGKAGSLVGRRGDILVPTAFIEQSQEQFQLIPSDAADHVRSMQARVGQDRVHSGSLLTVQGTLLQNREMLHYYRKLWQTIGLEMEGHYYFRQVMEARETGLLPTSAAIRFLYYVSDLPLDTASNLSERLRASEGVPPLYAISRDILKRILTQKPS